jgi:hypothetical protein
MATYTAVSFYFAMAVAVIGSLIILALPTRRRHVLDAIRHPFGGPDEDLPTESVTEIAAYAEWRQTTRVHAAHPEGAHPAHHV